MNCCSSLSSGSKRTVVSTRMMIIDCVLFTPRPGSGGFGGVLTPIQWCAGYRLGAGSRRNLTMVDVGYLVFAGFVSCCSGT
jgi:hypothetical protein